MMRNGNSVSQQVKMRQKGRTSTLENSLRRHGKTSRLTKVGLSEEGVVHKGSDSVQGTQEEEPPRRYALRGFLDADSPVLDPVKFLNTKPPLIKNSKGQSKRHRKDDFSDEDEYFSSEEDTPSKKKKFYFVANGDRPAELYRTDLVHRMKQEDGNDSSSDEETPIIRMTDRWREEWNHGVQVPLHKKLPNFVVENLPSSSTTSADLKQKPFEMGDRLIAVHERRYVKERHRRITMKPLRHYQCDGFDRTYLRLLNDKRSSFGLLQIDEELFGNIMDQFETLSHQAIHRDLLAPLTAGREAAEFDEDACCDICRQPDFEEDDKIIFCDGCNVCVHQSCYGLDSVPPDEWLCKACTLLGYKMHPRCVLCPIMGGAMKCTRDGDAWAHVACALWIPEVRFIDVDHREPISHLPDIPNERWMLKCSVCDTKQGACIQCSVKTCTTAFHVSCGLRSGQIMTIEHESNDDSGVRLVSLCEKHTREAEQLDGSTRRRHSGEPKRPFRPRAQLKRLEEFFYLYVSPDEVARQMRVDVEVVDDIYEYWKLRRAENGNKSMISDVSEVEQHGVSDLLCASSSVLSKKLLIETRLRQNLEKARNLCYMIERREKTKKARWTTWKDMCSVIFDIIRNSKIPFSGRALERFVTTLSHSPSPEEPSSSPVPAALKQTSVRAMSVPALLGNEMALAKGTSQKHLIRERNGPDLPTLRNGTRRAAL